MGVVKWPISSHIYLKEKITRIDAIDNSLGLTGGYLGLAGAEAGFDQRYRVPGTTMWYQCSEGFDIGNGDNPVQSLTCTAGRKVDFSGVSQCRRKSIIKISTKMWLQQVNAWRALT